MYLLRIRDTCIKAMYIAISAVIHTCRECPKKNPPKSIRAQETNWWVNRLKISSLRISDGGRRGGAIEDDRGGGQRRSTQRARTQPIAHSPWCARPRCGTAADRRRPGVQRVFDTFRCYPRTVISRSDPPIGTSSAAQREYASLQS